MNQLTSYRILKMGLRVGLGIALSASLTMAQQSPRTPKEADIYCSGIATTQAIPADTYLITGEGSNHRITYWQGDNVYLNRGAEQGVKVGDEFEVIRPLHELLTNKWFKQQSELSRAMGQVYGDIGRVRVFNVLAKTSIATVTLSCDVMQRGDIVRPFTARPAPPYHEAKFDPYAPPSGKKAMVVTTKSFGVISGSGHIIYINLGSEQGVQVGNYFRAFRYQGTQNELLYQIRGSAYMAYGFGSTPVPYEGENLPRQVVGEGIVLRTGPNSSTVLVTDARQELYDGDYVELE